MNYKRIIPRLDIKDHNLVKGINLEGLRVLGKPDLFAKIYTDEYADELLYHDTVASLFGKNFLLDMINKVAKDIFIPLNVGGGIKSLNDIELILKAGADKVSINSEAVRNPKLISDAATKFGSSTISVSVQFIKTKNDIKVLIDNGREVTNLNIYNWLHDIQEKGAGEIIITDIANEGTGKGPNINEIEELIKKINIPTIYHGGIGTKEHVLNLVEIENLNGVCISSMLHYNLIRESKNNFLDEENFIGNQEFLKNKFLFGRFESVSLKDLKLYLKNYNIKTRVN